MPKTNQNHSKIGMLAHTCYLTDARVRRTAETLAENGFEVHVVSSKNPDKEIRNSEPAYEVVNSVHIHRVPLWPKRGNKLRYAYEYFAMLFWGAIKLNLLSLIKRFKVIHIHNMPDILVFSGLTLKWRRCKVLLDIHDPMVELFMENYQLERKNSIISMLALQERISYKFPNYLMTVSLPMVENIKNKIKHRNNGIKVIHNFPNQQIFPIRTDLNKWPYNKDKFVLLYCGTVTEHYRLDIAIHAIAQIHNQIRNIELQILGRGNRIEYILQLAEELGVGEKVKHIKPIPQSEVKNLMAAADIGISTHKNGVFGDLYFSTKILEFMTQGLPVLTSRTYTIEKYIPDDTIFYFKPLDAQDLAQQIVFMFDNPNIVMEKRERSKTLLHQYSWEKESRKLLKIYEQMVDHD